jgi:hypothetical protein
VPAPLSWGDCPCNLLPFFHCPLSCTPPTVGWLKLIPVESSNTARSELFFTSKLKSNRGYDQTLRDLRKSLKTSGLDYFDLYLMHSAIGGPDVRKEVWRAFVHAQKEGLVRSIGVSDECVLKWLRLVHSVGIEGGRWSLGRAWRLQDGSFSVGSRHSGGRGKGYM